MNRSSGIVAALTLLATAGASLAAPVTHFTQRSANSGEYVRSSDYRTTLNGSVFDATGQPISVFHAGSSEGSFGNGRGGSFVRTETSEVSAAANLAEGTLKARAYLHTGTNAPGSEPVDRPDLRYTAARAMAGFGDSLSFRDGGNAFLWGADDRFTFNFGVDGRTLLPVGQGLPSDTSNLTWTTLTLALYKPGGVDALAAFNTFNFTRYSREFGFNAAIAEFGRLNTNLTSLLLDRKGWCLGATLTPAGFCDGANFYQPVALDSNGAALVSQEFAPGSDFEFALTLEASARVDMYYENVFADLDFSHTLNLGFVAPRGATVFSGSGVLPGTGGGGGTPVPAPASWALAVLALAALTGTRRRSLQSQPGRLTPAA